MQRWQKEIRDSIRSIEQLKKYINLDSDEDKKLPNILKDYQMGITPYYLDLINPDDPNDPLKKLVIPSLHEVEDQGFFDQSGEIENIKVPGLQHKYKNTVLLLPTSVCAAYCRYCFRKRFTTGKIAKKETQIDWEKAFRYVKRNSEISNILVTGGDPLVLSNEKIHFMLDNLSKIDHVKTIRFGTKFPAFNPYRLLDAGFLQLIHKYSTKKRRLYIVSHFDHPKELTKDAYRCINATLKKGAIWINQAVLHKGINDDPKTLRKLFSSLSQAGVAPYYLFQMRPVKGSMNYRVPIVEGLKIFKESLKNLDGLARRVRYVMSHYNGKIEIIGLHQQSILMKYISNRDEEKIGKIFCVPAKEGFWLEDFTQ